MQKQNALDPKETQKLTQWKFKFTDNFFLQDSFITIFHIILYRYNNYALLSQMYCSIAVSFIV